MARAGNVRRGRLVIDRPGLVVPVRRDPAGVLGPTKSQARGSSWRRTSQGFYVPSGTESGWVEQRIVEAAVRAAGVGSVTGWAALRWLGDPWAGGLGRDGVAELPVPLLIGTHDLRPQPGIRLTAEGCRLSDRSVIDGLEVTSAIWSACFEARYAATLWQAVCWLDMAAAADLVSTRELEDFLPRMSGWTGIPQLRAALTEMDENAWSPQEVRLRLFWIRLAGLPRPTCNPPLFDRSGRHIVTPDLLDADAGVAVEYDGSLHLEGAARRRDRDRDELYQAHGLVVTHVFAGDYADPDRLISRLRVAYRSARREPAATRSWTLDPPPWWVSTRGVADRRSLNEHQRAILLRNRRLAG